MEHDFDRCLDRLHATDLEFASGSLDGLSNHGPMAAEALVQLGHGDRVEPFLDAYVARLRPRPPGRPIGERTSKPPHRRTDGRAAARMDERAAARADERAAALGDVSRAGDWIATWERELEARPWQDVLREAIPTLSDGVLASALHGFLRVAHATRSLERADTPSRRRELAHGLALWSARHQRLPGEPGRAPVPGHDAAAVFAALPRLDVPRRGLIFERLKVLEHEPAFAAAIDAWDASTFQLDGFVRAAAALGAAGVLGVPGSRIALVHVVTGASALRLVAPHLAPADTRRLAGHLLQAAAALWAVYGAPVRVSGAAPDAAAPDVAAPDAAAPGAAVPGVAAPGAAAPDAAVPDPATLRQRARSSMDDHAIKLTEAALREHALAPAPLLLRAAATLLEG